MRPTGAFGPTTPKSLAPREPAIRIPWRTRPVRRRTLRTTIGVILIVLGLVGLLYGGITYVRHQHQADLGPISVQTTERKTVPIPPLVAAIALVAGGALLVIGARGSRPQP